MERSARRFKTHPPDLWLDDDSSNAETAIPSPSSEVSGTSSVRTPSPSPRRSCWQPSPQEIREVLQSYANFPAGSGHCTSNKIKAAVQLGHTPPLAFYCQQPPAKYAHLVCDDQWAQQSPHLRCPHFPLVCHSEVRRHSYHGGEFLGIVVMRSNITTLPKGQTMQVECRIGLEDSVEDAVLWWLQAQVYLHTFFQRKLSSESDDVRLNRLRWKNTVTEETEVEMHVRLFVKGCSPEPVQEVILHDAPEKGEGYDYQPEVFGAYNLKLRGKEKNLAHLTWAVRHRPGVVMLKSPQKTLQNVPAQLGESRDLMPGDVLLCRITRQLLSIFALLHGCFGSSEDGCHVVVMPFADRTGSLPEEPDKVLVMKFNNGGRGALFKVSKTTLHPDPTVDISALYQPTVEVLQGQEWCRAKLSLHKIVGVLTAVICEQGDRAPEMKVDPGKVPLVMSAQLSAKMRKRLDIGDAQTLAQTSAHSA
eukprot:Skav210027  [mRNA]  locus=scaffold706:47613:49470:+ [translate_table: standard]